VPCSSTRLPARRAKGRGRGPNSRGDPFSLAEGLLVGVLTQPGATWAEPRVLVISDALEGPCSGLVLYFARDTWQRCKVHVLRNVASAPSPIGHGRSPRRWRLQPARP
jgi:hypothetical protein